MVSSIKKLDSLADLSTQNKQKLLGENDLYKSWIGKASESKMEGIK